MHSNELIHRRANPRNTISALVARGRLKAARKVFAANGWQILPESERGVRILEWAADHVWCSRSSHRAMAVLQFCCEWAPWAEEDFIKELLDALTNGRRNLNWSADQSALVLELDLDRCRELKLQKFLGASDDLNYDRRRGIAAKGEAARSKKYRAKKSTGRPRGRPKREGPKEFELAGYASERTYFRHKALGILAPKNGSRNSSRNNMNKNLMRDGISLPNPTAVDRRALARDGAELQIIEIDDDAVDGGSAWAAPPQQRPSPPPTA